MARIIKASTNPGDIVMDPFSGSASTLVVAAVLRRNYIGFDIDPKYAELGQQRVIELLKTGIRDIDEKEEKGGIEHPKKSKTQMTSLFGSNYD